MDWVLLAMLMIPLGILLHSYPKEYTSNSVEMLFNWAVWSIGLLVVVMVISITVSKILY